MAYIAFDAGTTTLAARLGTEDGIFSAVTENPQRKIGGADSVSRILAASDPKRKDRLTELLRGGISDLLISLCRDAGISARDVTSAAFCGNTVMTAYFAGEDPSGMGVYPFTPPELFGRETEIPGSGLSCPVYLFPCASAFIGGDAISDVLSLLNAGTETPALLADMGTNGELMLLTKDRLLGASAAAGPAFEGASLACGSAAKPGAVSSVSDDGSLTVIGGGAPRSLCGSGVISAAAYMLRHGLCTRSGVIAGEGVPLDRRYYLAPDVYLSGGDIRELLMAKAAICAGVSALLRHGGLSPSQLASVRLSGSFGEWLSAEDTAEIGLFPREMADAALPVGNSALTGAFAAAGDPTLRKKAQELAASLETVTLASDPDFSEEFIRCMEF